MTANGKAAEGSRTPGPSGTGLVLRTRSRLGVRLRSAAWNPTHSTFFESRIAMKLTFRNDRLLAVVAHPDDAGLLCAGTLARAARDGAAIALCGLCRRDNGEARQQIANLPAERRHEIRALAKHVG